MSCSFVITTIHSFVLAMSTIGVFWTYQSRNTRMFSGCILGLTSVTFASVPFVQTGIDGMNSISPTSTEARTGSVMSTLSTITRLESFVTPTRRSIRKSFS